MEASQYAKEIGAVVTEHPLPAVEGPVFAGALLEGDTIVLQSGATAEVFTVFAYGGKVDLELEVGPYGNFESLTVDATHEFRVVDL